MRCPDCGGKSKCMETRHVDGNIVKRVYKCYICKERFRTMEGISIKDNLIDVIKIFKTNQEIALNDLITKIRDSLTA